MWNLISKTIKHVVLKASLPLKIRMLPVLWLRQLFYVSRKSSTNLSSSDDDLVLGVRIYTQGRAVVSVTGQVVNEEIIEVDEHDNAAKGKEDDKKDAKDDKNEDEDDKKEDEDDKKEDEDNKKEGKKAKKAKDKKKKHACIPYP